MVRKLKKSETIDVVTKETVKPFIKWAGGKTQLLPEIAIRLPKKWKGNYFEPFVGGGAVFFWIRSTNVHVFSSYLTDVNADLINAYRMVATNVEDVIVYLREHQRRHHRAPDTHYYGVRSETTRGSIVRAARFIYLNKSCFNGLYRVNAKGVFNVPIGRFKSPPLICDEKTLRACSKILAASTYATENHHEHAIDGAHRGDFIYCDPPYLPKSETAEFTSYTKGGFTISDHERLRDALVRADKRGAFWMLSEGDSPIIRKMFKSFNVMPVHGSHSVAASADSRGKSKELLITNYTSFMPWHIG